MEANQLLGSLCLGRCLVGRRVPVRVDLPSSELLLLFSYLFFKIFSIKCSDWEQRLTNLHIYPERAFPQPGAGTAGDPLQGKRSALCGAAGLSAELVWTVLCLGLPHSSLWFFTTRVVITSNIQIILIYVVAFAYLGVRDNSQSLYEMMTVW